MPQLLTLTRENDGIEIRVPKTAIAMIAPREDAAGTRIDLSNGSVAVVRENVAEVAALFETD